MQKMKNYGKLMCIGLSLVSSLCLANAQQTTPIGIPPTLANFAPAPSTNPALLDMAVSELINANHNGGLMDMDVPRLDTAQTHHIAWAYSLQADEFSNHVWRQARLVSNDYNVSLLISFDKKDTHLKNPSVFLVFSGDWDNGVHSPLCDDECTLDMTVGAFKYPNIQVRTASLDVLAFQDPNFIVSQLQNATTLKIRIQSITGQHLIYQFTPNGALALGQLR